MYVWAIITISDFKLPHNFGMVGTYKNLEECENDRFFLQNTIITKNPQYTFYNLQSFCFNTTINLTN